ncbi:hypothetical protein AB0I28_14265 [Phytomonospora sp. NPDC050363]|uniref:hypothetical protein n=1 Tax=Phytomonospora sp. NPDC050363 TaxID=3155642 RepID=UPI003409B5C7
MSAVAVGLVLLIYLVVPILLAVGRALSGEYDRSGELTWRAGSDLGHVVTDPVRTWLQAGAADLPVGWQLLWTLWCATGVTLFVSGTLTVRGARVGWLLFGLGTAAMVYAETPAASAWAAVGVTAAWWALGTLFVLRRPTAPRLRVEPDLTAQGHATRDACDLLDALAEAYSRDEARADTAARIRQVRTALLAPRIYPVVTRDEDDANHWRERLAAPLEDQSSALG